MLEDRDRRSGGCAPLVPWRAPVPWRPCHREAEHQRRSSGGRVASVRKPWIPPGVPAELGHAHRVREFPSVDPRLQMPYGCLLHGPVGSCVQHAQPGSAMGEIPTNPPACDRKRPQPPLRTRPAATRARAGFTGPCGTNGLRCRPGIPRSRRRSRSRAVRRDHAPRGRRRGTRRACSPAGGPRLLRRR